MTYSIAHLLDTRGLVCPEPVMMLHKTVRTMKVGSVVKVIASDPSTVRDVPKFCAFLAHELLEHSCEEGLFYFHIRKGEQAQTQQAD